MSAPRREHSVVFVSPGTFFQETTRRPVESWDPKLAVTLSETILERYNARPYAFAFETHLVADPVPDGAGGELAKLAVLAKRVERSGLYFLGGHLETLDDVEARNDPKESILRGNMRSPEACIVCVNTNSFRSVVAFDEKDVLVDATGTIIERGDDLKHVAYRAARRAAEA